MLFSWWKNRRRNKILQNPFPRSWDAILRSSVRPVAALPKADQIKLRRIVQILLAEKEWEGCGGLELNDEVLVTVAALAAILILGFDDFFFDNVQTILVYPDEYVVPEEQSLAGDVTIRQESNRLGEAHKHGPVILSWAEVRENARAPGKGQNLIYHEFAHQLDMLNGEFDGTPSLPTSVLRQQWSKIMDREYRHLQMAERRGRATLLDPYGATNPAEFFAVTTECFFDAPQAMRQEYPELFELFRDYYRQDPASWALWSISSEPEA